MKFYLIAGEASGELHGSNLVKALKAQAPDTQFRGMGGDRMQAAGVELVRHNAQDNHMGVMEVLRHLPDILRLITRIQQDILAWKPDAVVLIDYPGFNLRIAKFCKAHGIRVFYYITPQVWAWKAGRTKQLQAYCDRLYPILPFEPAWFAARGVASEYHGHPLLDAVAQVQDDPNYLKRDAQLDDRPILALLPGSRRFEIKNMLPAMLEAAAPYRQSHQIVVAGAPHQPRDFYLPLLQNTGVKLVENRTYDLLRLAHAAIVTSGTATLETALFGVPQVMCYKANPLSYIIGRMLVKIKYAALPNLILDRLVIQELLQGDMNAQTIGAELKKLLEAPDYRSQMKQNYTDLRTLLGNEGASTRVAASMLARIKGA